MIHNNSPTIARRMTVTKTYLSVNPDLRILKQMANKPKVYPFSEFAF